MTDLTRDGTRYGVQNQQTISVLDDGDQLHAARHPIDVLDAIIDAGGLERVKQNQAYTVVAHDRITNPEHGHTNHNQTPNR